MTLISRFTSNEALDFEFKLPEDGLRNRQTLFVSQVAINFTAAPTTAGDVQIYISDDEARIKSGNPRQWGKHTYLFYRQSQSQSQKDQN